MMLATLLLALMIIALFAWLMTGFPVAFVLAGTALMFGTIGAWAGVLDGDFIALLPNRIYGIIRNELLLAIPLFIAMGTLLERSKIAEDLLDSMGALFGPIRGGLGISVTIVGALLAASTGIVGATVVTMGLISLPTMLKRGYDQGLATGAIAAAGTLGQIIPPSIVLILLADQLSNAYQEAQRDLGVISPEPLSVGELFAGALIPGLGLVLLYMLYQVGMALFRPQASPAIHDPDVKRDRAFWIRLMQALVPPIFLIIAVLGAILTGIATPTEAAAVGAVGAILLSGARLHGASLWGGRLLYGAFAALTLLFALPLVLPAKGIMVLIYILGFTILIAGLMVALERCWTHKVLQPVLLSTVRTTAMIYTILIGAALFALVFRGLGGKELIETVLGALPGGTAGAVLLVMAVMFVLGFFLDFIEITFIVVPIVAPILLVMGIDPVWLGIMMAVNLQTSFLTPPFGFALFYLRGVAPDTVRTAAIYRGAAPFVTIQLIGLGLLALWPGLATWLPAKLLS